MTVNRDIIWETVRVKFTVTRQRGVKLEMKDRELNLLYKRNVHIILYKECIISCTVSVVVENI